MIRIRHRKLLIMGLLMFLVAVVLAACGGESEDTISDDAESTETEKTDDADETEEADESAESDEPDESAASGGDLQVAFYQQPPTLDIHMTTSAASYMVGRHIFEGLMALTEDYESVPMLAESVDESDDGLTYTFHLREGVMFHNGQEMTAEDVIASMERWREINTGSDLVFGGSTWESDGDYTVVLTLEKPATGVLESLAAVLQAPVIMPKEVIDDADATGVQEYIGTGPFKFVEWEQDKHIHVEKFDDYIPVEEEPNGFAGKKEALVDNIYFELVLDASTRLADITTAQYDVAYALSNDDYDQMTKDDTIETYEAPSGNAYLIFNEHEPSKFIDPVMRQAVNAALNIDEIMLGGFKNENLFDVDHGFMSKYAKSWYSESGLDYFNQQDLDKAVELLEEAGYDGEEVVLLTDRSHPTIYGMAVVVQEQLAQIGMDVHLESYDWATVSEKRTDPENWDFYVNNVPEVVIPAQLLPLSATWPGWADEEKFVNYHEQIIDATSQDEAYEIWSEMQEYAWSEYVPVVKFGNYYSLDVATNKVEMMSSFLNPMLWNTSIVE